MKTFWKVSNIILFAIQATICALGTFYKHIAFGWGLGDLFGYFLMYASLLTHFILLLASLNKGISRHRNLTIIFLIWTIYFCLQATVWRDNEYPWNGNIFYH